MDSKKKKMGPVQKAIVSGAAAGLSHMIHHPLYTLKSQMMYHGKNFSFREFLRVSIMKQPSGVQFLYRGLLPRTVGVMPEKVFKMIGWNTMCDWQKLNRDEPTLRKLVVAGAAAGAATTLIGCPSERAMVLAQVRKQGFLVVVRQAGLRGLYLGWTATLYRDIMFNVAMFTIRELTVAQWKAKHDRKDVPFFTEWGLGILAGIIAATVGCPFDVIKTRMQGKKLGDVYESCSTIMLNIIRREGLRYLFKGLGPRLISVPSMMAAFFAINSKLETLTNTSEM